MNRIDEIYYSLKELFGPKIQVEIISSTQQEDLHHVKGDKILLHIQSKKFNNIELEKILIQKLEKMPYQIEALVPFDIFKVGIESVENTVLNFEQFPEFSRMVNFGYNQNRYTAIISSPVFNYRENQDFLVKFWKTVERNINDETKNLVSEYLKLDMPHFIKKNFQQVYNLLLKISMSKVENKNISTGLIFVEDYEHFKVNFYDDLFLDLDVNLDIRDIEEIKQPFLEVSNGKRSFLIVDKRLKICGLFFPDKMLEGIYLSDSNTKKLNNCVIAKIDGVDLIRVVVNSKIVFEIQNGIHRKRDYNTFSTVIEEIISDLGIDRYCKKFEQNLVEIASKRKGTIIVLGDRLNSDKYVKCIKGEISIIKERIDSRNDDLYREYILSQLSQTDGAILVDRELKIYAFGAILKVQDAGRDNQGNSGGSRSYTALRFAYENSTHAVIKISEDGPISVYYHGERKIEI